MSYRSSTTSKLDQSFENNLDYSILSARGGADQKDNCIPPEVMNKNKIIDTFDDEIYRRIEPYVDSETIQSYKIKSSDLLVRHKVHYDGSYSMKHVSGIIQVINKHGSNIRKATNGDQVHVDSEQNVTLVSHHTKHSLNP